MKGICTSCSREFGGELIGVACPDCGKEVVELSVGIPATGKLSPGTVVFLNSGGPALTVMSCDENSAMVGWFTEAGNYGMALVPLACLTVEPPFEDEEDFEGNN